MKLAHVNWFVNNENIPLENQIAHFQLSESVVQVWLVAIVVCLFLAWMLDRFVPEKKEWIKNTKTHFPLIMRIFEGILGAWLLFSAVQGFLFDPSLDLSGRWGSWISMIEAGLGVLLLINRGGIWKAGVLAILYLIAIGLSERIETAFESIHIVGLIGMLHLFQKTSTSSKLWKKFEAFVLPLLRITIGLSLIVLAFSEKLLDPTNAFFLLQNYPFNFMSSTVDDRLFVLSAGAMEVLFGLIFILGWIPRINTLALLVFFLSTNACFFVLGFSEQGTQELVGHLPVLAAALLFVAYGGGNKKEFNS
jgi:uncharacterized membrane protein YphA (DoxX/SURF4 family)